MHTGGDRGWIILSSDPPPSPHKFQGQERENLKQNRRKWEKVGEKDSFDVQNSKNPSPLPPVADIHLLNFNFNPKFAKLRAWWSRCAKSRWTFCSRYVPLKRQVWASSQDGRTGKAACHRLRLSRFESRLRGQFWEVTAGVLPTTCLTATPVEASRNSDSLARGNWLDNYFFT